MTTSPDTSPVTELLERWSDGDKRAFDELMPLVVDELRRLARAQLGREGEGHTLQPTALRFRGGWRRNRTSPARHCSSDSETSTQVSLHPVNCEPSNDASESGTRRWPGSC